VKKTCVPCSRSDISAQCGSFNANYMFSRYIAWCLVGLEYLDVDFGVSQSLKNRNVRNPKKSQKKSSYCAQTVCCCVNFEHFDFFLNVVHVYQPAGHLVGEDIPLSDRKKNRRRYEKVCKS
jgi:hypothetical protein